MTVAVVQVGVVFTSVNLLWTKVSCIKITLYSPLLCSIILLLVHSLSWMRGSCCSENCMMSSSAGSQCDRALGEWWSSITVVLLFSFLFLKKQFRLAMLLRLFLKVDFFFVPTSFCCKAGTVQVAESLTLVVSNLCIFSLFSFIPRSSRKVIFM